jgi:hypothetical protein
MKRPDRSEVWCAVATLCLFILMGVLLAWRG